MAQYLDLVAWGHGLASISTPPAHDGREPEVLDVWYPFPILGSPEQTHPPVGFEAPEVITEAVAVDQARGVETMVLFTVSRMDLPPVDVADVYLRLDLLASGLAEPGTVNLEGYTELLPNVAWTDLGPCLPADIEKAAAYARAHKGHSLRIEKVCQVRPKLQQYLGE
ncbi:MAG: hypothetical protein LBB58_03415 [Cellulomonadaceae bacterium]|jgi:2,3,4,5-tetrahydropyridine-2-carboxylate N-succinyltransferase|nr:hypothetical protein [Cellulomonadaceae bacterium]